MRNIQFLKIIWLLFYVFIFCMLLYNSFGYLDNDLGWHLKAGEEIVEEHMIPKTEHYSYILEGELWVDHEWLLNAFSYIVFNDFGYFVLNLFFAFLIIIILVFQKYYLQKYFLKNIKADFWLMIFQLLGVRAALPHLGIRMQEISILAILLLLFIVHKFNVTKDRKILFWLILLFWLWANMHGGFLVGLVLLGFFVFVKILENLIETYDLVPKIKMSFKNKLDYRSIFYFIVFSFISFLVTFINPYGWRLYEYFYTDFKKTSYYLSHISEWIPFYYIPVPYYQLLYIAIVLSFLVVAVYFSLKRISTDEQEIVKNKKFFWNFDLWYLSITLLFVFFALKSRRHFPLLFIVSMPMIVIFYIEQIAINLKRQIKDTKLVLFSKIVLILILIISSYKMVVKTQFNDYPFDSGYYCMYNYPCAAVSFIKENGLTNKRFFNDYDWGGFIVWVMPEMKLFIDGRLPQVEFKDHSFLEEYHEFFNEEKVKEKLEDYGIELVLLKKHKPIKLNWVEKYIFLLNEEKINDVVDYLEEFIKNSDQWRLVYSDDFSYIYEKQNTESR